MTPLQAQAEAFIALAGATTIAAIQTAFPKDEEDLFNKIVDVSAKWKETADRMEKEHGFINFRLRSISIYDDAEAKHIKDYKDFE